MVIDGDCSFVSRHFFSGLCAADSRGQDSFLWDDGWDDPHTLWEFDQERFPARFDEDTGCWVARPCMVAVVKRNSRQRTCRDS